MHASVLAPVVTAPSALKVDLDLLIIYVHSLPTALRELESFHEIIQNCDLGLLDIFGDVPSVNGNEEQMAKFCQIPHAAFDCILAQGGQPPGAFRELCGVSSGRLGQSKQSRAEFLQGS